jgi:hypothetical protein
VEVDPTRVCELLVGLPDVNVLGVIDDPGDGPTEAANNLIKRVKRVAFGFTNFRNYRVRAVLYAGRPNWDLLATLTPR